MNNFRRISAIILSLCIGITVFASCNNDESTDITTTTEKAEITEIITEIITEKQTVNIEVTDKKGDVSVSVSEKIITVPVTRTITVTQNKETDNIAKATTKKSSSNTVNLLTAVSQTQNRTAASILNNNVTKATAVPVKTTVSTTKRPIVDDKIDEKSVGIFMMTKTDPVQVGNHATIFVQGTPGKTYSIEFYETPSSISKQSSLEDKKADANGFVTWTFEIGNTCNLGKRKLVIKEKNSSNYLETSITVK